MTKSKKRIPNCFLSLGDIAKITMTGRATVLRWVMNGYLIPAYHLPSENSHTKIELKELRRFLRDNKMPTLEKFLTMHDVEVTVKVTEFKLTGKKTSVKKKKRKVK